MKTTTKKPVRTKLATKKKVSAKKAPTIPFADSTRISKVKERPKGGGKTKLLALIPRSGIAASDLVVRAAAADIDSAQVHRWLPFLRRYGYIRY